MFDLIKNAEEYRDAGALQQAINEAKEEYSDSYEPEEMPEFTPILRFYESYDEDEQSLSFHIGFTEGFGGVLMCEHFMGTIEEELFYSAEYYSPQDMEAVSSIHSADFTVEQNKLNYKEFSDVWGTFFSTPDKPRFDKVKTKDCVQYLSTFTGNTKHKRTSKYNIGNFVVREFDKQYQIIEYKGCLVMISKLN